MVVVVMEVVVVVGGGGELEEEEEVMIEGLEVEKEVISWGILGKKVEWW